VRGAGVAAAERLGLRVAARVRRLPVREAVVALDALRVRGAPLAAADGLREMPLALQRDVVAALAQPRRERVDSRWQLGLVSALGTEPEKPAGKGAGKAPAGHLAGRREAGNGADHVGKVARVGEQVALGQRQRDPVTRGVLSRQEARAARRAHRGRGERAREVDPRPPQLGVVGRERIEPPRILGPVLRRTLLIGDEEDEVRRAVGHEGAQYPP
jgi:hypothetical protein